MNIYANGSDASIDEIENIVKESSGDVVDEKIDGHKNFEPHDTLHIAKYMISYTN